MRLIMARHATQHVDKDTRMAYDITNMRTALQQQVSPRYSDGATGFLIEDSFKHMRVSNDTLAERSASQCLIPRNDGSVLVQCTRPTANSHSIQEKVLQSIATDNRDRHEVLDFMPIKASRIAKECQGPNGEPWHKKPWDIDRLMPKPAPVKTASARHFACNICDNTTFRPIEDVTIPWPSWPSDASLDDLKLDQTQRNFSDQLFLFAYRCLLQHISYFRSLIAADGYAVDRKQIDENYRTVLRTRQALNRQTLGKLTNLKTKYDRRLVGLADLPMAHRILPVKPAFPIASTAFTPSGNSHISTTVYPEHTHLPDGDTELRHWLVISIETGHQWALLQTVKALATAAKQTFDNRQSSIDWTVQRITTPGFLSTYANPESYSAFREGHPAAADRIERNIPDTIVIEYYERHLGKALYLR